jgi:hypothetical protein
MKTYIVTTMMSDSNNLVSVTTEIINADSGAEAEGLAIRKYVPQFPQFSIDNITSMVITKDMVL